MDGHSNAESKARKMSTKANLASCNYLRQSWTFLDCHGYIELAQDGRNSTIWANTAVVGCEADEHRTLVVAPILNYLNKNDVPHIVFINKMDVPLGSIRVTFKALQSILPRLLVLHEIPIRENGNMRGI